MSSTGLREALAVHDANSTLLERRGLPLSLPPSPAGLVADDLVAVPDRADAPNVETHRGVELQRVAGPLVVSGLAGTSRRSPCGSGLMKITMHFERPDRSGELAHRLGHEARLAPTVASPMSPSSSALGVRAATEIDHHHADPPERTSVSVKSRALLAVSGWETAVRRDRHRACARKKRVESVFGHRRKRRHRPSFCSSATA